MSHMIEVFVDEGRKEYRSEVIEFVAGAFGQLTHEENNRDEKHQKGICLTFEFDSVEKAQCAANILTGKGFHVEGPCDY